jgi:hypothetical protein
MKCNAPPFVLMAALSLSPLHGAETPKAGAAVDESLAVATVYVDHGKSAAAKSGRGTRASPLSTIGQAAAVAVANNAKGIGTRILIAPGNYRERVDLIANGKETSAPVIFQAQPGGSVILTGSDLWVGWDDLGHGLYAHPWPYAWGLAPYPSGWQGSVTLQDIVRRREMVFVNGVSMQQELGRGQLGPGHFYVDEHSKVLYVEPPTGTDMQSANLEISTRSNLLYISGKRNIVVRGLTFEHETSFVQQGGPLQIIDSSNVLIDGCKLLWNSTGGPLVRSSDHVTVQNTSSSTNGFGGMAGYRLTYSLIANVDTSMNNWRGARGKFTYWDTAGAKFLLSHHDVFQNHSATGNQAPGLWLDTDTSDVVIRAGKWTDNFNDGLFIEASEGPISVIGSCSARNGGSGILISDSTNVDLGNPVVYGNRGSQVHVTGASGGRWVQNFETGQVYDHLKPGNLTGWDPRAIPGPPVGACAPPR